MKKPWERKDNDESHLVWTTASRNRGGKPWTGWWIFANGKPFYCVGKDKTIVPRGNASFFSPYSKINVWMDNDADWAAVTNKQERN